MDTASTSISLNLTGTDAYITEDASLTEPRISIPEDLRDRFDVTVNPHQVLITEDRTRRKGWPFFYASVGSYDSSISIAVPRLGPVSIDSKKGDVRIDGHVPILKAKLGVGDVTVQSLDSCDIKAGVGDVHVIAARHALVATGSGDIIINRFDPGDSQWGPSRIRCGSGDVLLRSVVGTAEGYDVDVTSGSGDIQVFVLSGTAVNLDCATGTGDISLELDDSEEPAPGTPRVFLTTRTGTGDQRIGRTA